MRGRLLAFGIAPTRPETGYGYIQTGKPLTTGHVIDRFVEKPDRATAERFVADGSYVWNGGIFVFRAGDLLAELARQRSEMAKQVREAWAGQSKNEFLIHPAPKAFAAIAGESIDYAVMDGATAAAVVAADMGWSDIGTWDALMDARAADRDGNRISGHVDLHKCRNVMVEAATMRVSVVDLEDVVIVVDGNDVLVTSRAGAQDVGKLPGAQGR